MDSILDWLEGYRKGKVLIDHQLTWVPLVQIYAPPGGSATVTYTRSSQSSEAAGFKILGSGFGTSGTLNIPNAFTIPVSQRGKQILVQLFVTYTSKVCKGKPPIYQLDFEAPDATAVALKVNDLPAPTPVGAANAFDIRQWNDLGEFDLSEAHDRELATRTYDRKEAATWEIDLGISITEPVKTDLTATASFAVSDEWVTTYKLPWGHIYYLYGRPNEYPLVPMIACV